MSFLLAISLALGASVCYGVSNFIGPLLVRQHTLVSVLVIGQLAALAGCAIYLAASRGAALPADDVGYAVLAGTGNACGLIWFYKATQLGPISVVAPIGATGAIVPVVWGLATGDALRATQVVGMALALAGAAAAARRPAQPAGDPATDYPDPVASAWWAAASAVAFGVFLTALPAASAHGRAWALFDARVALVAGVALWAGRRLREVSFSRTSRPMVLPGLLLLAGTLLYTVAADHGELSLVSVLGSLFPVVTVGLGVTLLQERLSGSQLAGVTAALSGIILISL